VCVKTPRARLLLSVLRSAHRRISLGLPRALSIKVDVPPALGAAPLDPHPMPAARNFREAYMAHCDCRRAVPNIEFALHAIECGTAPGASDSSEGERVRESGALDLSTLPSIEENDSARCDLAALCAALKYNDFFRSLELRNVNLRNRQVKLVRRGAGRGGGAGGCHH
jgi:hypothetical protein